MNYIAVLTKGGRFAEHAAFLALQPTKSCGSHDTHNILPGRITMFYRSSSVHLAAQVEQLDLSVSLKSTLIVVVEAINN